MKSRSDRGPGERRARASLSLLPFILALLSLGCSSTPDYGTTFQVLDKTLSLIERDIESGRLFPAVPLDVKAEEREAERERMRQRRLAMIKQARGTIKTARGDQ